MNYEELKSKWNQCLAFILDIVGESRFNAWFAKSHAISIDEQTITIGVPSNYFVELYDERFFNLLHAALKKVFGRPLQIFYKVSVLSEVEDAQVILGESRQSKVLKSKVDNSTVVNVNPALQSAPKNGQRANSQLNPAYTFENYCSGDSNRLALTIAENIAAHPRNNDFNPFFLYGDVGIGKTHLIQAIGIRVKEQNPQAKVFFTTARDFQHFYSQAAISKTVPKFINWFMDLDVLLLDDLQELSGKVKTSETLFPIFNHLHQNGKQLVFTCDRPPMELDGLTDRLIDRFKWGLTERLPKPDAELRKKILTFKAQKNGLDFPPEVIDFIAANAVNSVREIEGVVMGILTRSITLNAPITLDLARDVMKNTIAIPDKKNINFEMIVECTAEYFNLNPDTIFSKSRLRDINDARQIIMYLSSKLTGLSSTVIGRKLNRQHGTVLHGISAVKERIPLVDEVSKAVSAIEAELAR
ncbi:MAG: chromosomal replication initiator protein DnaA [Muribaculaceae bacterium]|nr:chromosomal replication initiator protein DnaA [Muribaculaceae bacterium]